MHYVMGHYPMYHVNACLLGCYLSVQLVLSLLYTQPCVANLLLYSYVSFPGYYHASNEISPTIMLYVTALLQQLDQVVKDLKLLHLSSHAGNSVLSTYCPFLSATFDVALPSPRSSPFSSHFLFLHQITKFDIMRSVNINSCTHNEVIQQVHYT